MKAASITSILFSAMLFASCSKNNGNNTPYYPDDYGEFTYEIKGLNDTSVEQTSNNLLLVEVKKLSGPTEDLKLVVAGMPTGMTASFDPEVAKPPFSAFLTIKAARVAEGTYPLTVTSTSKTTILETKTFNVKVTPYSNAATGLEGVYTNSGSCTPSTGAINHDAKVVVSPAAINQIIIQALWSPSWSSSVTADLNRTNKTITIAEQQTNNLTFSGTGTYTENSMTINYTVKNATVNESCTVTFTRQ